VPLSAQEGRTAGLRPAHLPQGEALARSLLRQPLAQASLEADIHSSTLFVAVFEADPLTKAAPESELLHVYPNPSGGLFRISLPSSWPLSGAMELEVTDILGKSVQFLHSPV
jgi:hypothetical protein